MKRWYAVQVWDENDCGYGSTVKREAVKMANAEKRNPRNDGKEIRIVVMSDTTNDAYPVEEIIIREGDR